MRVGGAGSVLAGATLTAASALAQPAPSWEGERAIPGLDEAWVVDATGEPDWPFGAEDVAGDGAAFTAAEAAVDARSVYVARGDAALWTRVYFAGDATPPAELTVYLFVDEDQDATTGGPATAAAIDAALVTDPSPGGYEHLVAATADGAAAEVWAWDGEAWVGGERMSPASTEIGVAPDPLRLGGEEHGFLQLVVDHGTAGLDAACTATLFFRTTAGGAVRSDGDLEVGAAAGCAPRDADRDRVPDAVAPPTCARDADCPGGGICVGGECLIPVSCREDADCTAGEECAGGRCVAVGGEDCETDADCAPLVCDRGTCGPCRADVDCEDGRCAPDGTCVRTAAPPAGSGGAAGAGGTTGDDGITLEPGDEVRGGACTCGAAGSPAAGAAAWGALAALAALVGRRRRSEP